MSPPTRAECAALDAADPLRRLYERFDLPEEGIYLDGNSLGALPAATFGRLRSVIQGEWGRGLITSWERAGWWELPRTLGDRIAPLVGAAPGEVILGDSTSVNLFKVLVAACRMRPGRRVVLCEAETFPTDRYVLESVARSLGGLEIRYVAAEPDRIREELGPEVAAVLFTHVDYRSGALLDLAATTPAVHGVAALAVFDLCHSVGVVPVDLDDIEVDFAVGCTYKYLNGGPGSPAFAYVAARHHEILDQPIPGWGGHARPFDFAEHYLPAAGAARLSSGTPSVLALAALEASIECYETTSIEALRKKSLALSTLFITCTDELDAAELALVTPRDPARRGSHLAYRHPRAAELRDELARRAVLCDYRPPGLLRIGLAPMYVRYVDVHDAVATLGEVLATCC